MEKLSGKVTSNSITLTIDGVAQFIEFRTGGMLAGSPAITSEANGVRVVENLYAETTCDGQISIDSSLLKYLVDSYKSQLNGKGLGSVIHKQKVSKGDGTFEVIKRVFNNASIKEMVDLDIQNHGGSTDAQTVKIMLSLNDENYDQFEASSEKI